MSSVFAPTCPRCGFIASRIHESEWWCERCQWTCCALCLGLHEFEDCPERKSDARDDLGRPIRQPGGWPEAMP